MVIPMKMLRSNFESALYVAMHTDDVISREHNIGRSIFAAGLCDVLMASQRGETIEIVDG